MLKRIMPCLLFNGSGLTKTVKFTKPNYIGDPINAIKIFNEKEVDEIILLDIQASTEKRKPLFDKIHVFTSEAFMPFTYGGGVSEMQDFDKLFSLGVEKVSVNTLIYKNPNLVKDACKKFGSQSIIGAIDIKKNIWGKEKIYNKNLGYFEKSLEEHIKYLQNDLGVGEILLQNVEREGTWAGIDQQLIQKASKICKVPIIVLGGTKDIDDIKNALYVSNADAVALGSMSVYQKKGMGVLINFPKRNAVIENEFQENIL